MERHFEAELKQLKERLTNMASLVEKAIADATEGLQNSDPAILKRVYETENEINRCHISVDEACLRLLALQQPLARDLRLIIAVIKINTDLERMGDQAMNIVHNAERYIRGESVKPLVHLPVMFEETRFMVKEAIESFVRNDESAARDVLKRDDKVDGLKHLIFKDVLEVMKDRRELIEQGLSLILIARNLERIGDHSTNIAEDVIFAITGEDIRHGVKLESVKAAHQKKL